MEVKVLLKAFRNVLKSVTFIICKFLYICYRLVQLNLVVRPRKKKTLFYGHDRPKFSFWQKIIFFLNFFQNLVKISRFCTKIWQFWLKFLENKSKYFPKSFLQKKSKFSWNFCVFGSFFGTINKKIEEEKKSPDRPYLAGPSARKTGFLFFVALVVCLWFYMYVWCMILK